MKNHEWKKFSQLIYYYSALNFCFLFIPTFVEGLTFYESNKRKMNPNEPAPRRYKLFRNPGITGEVSDSTRKRRRRDARRNVIEGNY